MKAGYSAQGFMYMSCAGETLEMHLMHLRVKTKMGYSSADLDSLAQFCCTVDSHKDSSQKKTFTILRSTICNTNSPSLRDQGVLDDQANKNSLGIPCDFA